MCIELSHACIAAMAARRMNHGMQYPMDADVSYQAFATPTVIEVWMSARAGVAIAATFTMSNVAA